jgi:two-component system chemotaxis response regulator CheY
MNPKVLVVDDSQMVRAMVGKALQGAGFQTIEATDGVDAIAQLTANADTKLVVCDVNMPRMGGIEFLEALVSKALSVPVVMLTTEGQPELIVRAKALGARGWLVKPFKADLLVATAKKLTAA